MIYVGQTAIRSSQGWQFVGIDEDRAVSVEALNGGEMFRIRTFNGVARHTEMALMRDSALALLSALMHALDDGSDPFLLVRPQHVDANGNPFNTTTYDARALLGGTVEKNGG